MASKKAAKPFTFKLHGQPFNPTGSVAVFAKVGLIQAVLNKTAGGDLMTGSDLAGKCGLSPRGISEYSSRLRESGFCFKIGSRNYYGSKETIAELVKQIDN